MHIESYAKINLGLRVLGRRTDGFHEIETIFQQISLKDDLEIELIDRDRDIEIKTIPPVCPDNETNLAFRAAKILQGTMNRRLGCRIVIRKNIPIGAGLGGGSSNAAATLTAMNELLKAGLNRKKLTELASRLGSDVPFFILGGTALGEGRGEKLTPLKSMPVYTGLLISPPLHISSAWAYQNSNFSLTKTFKKSKLRSFTRISSQTEKWRHFLRNDLEDVVFHKYPYLKEVVDRLYDLGAFHARMSGSGSSLFGLFESGEVATTAGTFFKKEFDTFLFEPVNEGGVL